MAILDMFDKLDDIIYEPIKAICEWTKEPLRHFEDKRKKSDAQLAADIEFRKKEQEAELESRRKKEAISLEMYEKKWNADIDDLISRQEIQRNEKILNSIIEYRRSMIEDAKEIADSLSHMEMALVEEAHTLVLKKTEEYKALQDKARKQCDDEIEEIGRRFADNERVRLRREDMVLDQTDDIVAAAKSFISALNEDIKRINANNTNRVNKATEATDKILDRMGRTLAIESSLDSDSYKGLESGKYV